ncbi:MAG: hypothetical protein ACOCQX_04960, partial [Candidatus Nanoarchaeia archaeon]
DQSEGSQCPEFQRCNFLKENVAKDSMKMAVEGFKQKYCKGNYEKCKRYAIGKKIGHDKLPANMMPNGLPITGTNDDDWSDEVKSMINSV